MEVEQLEGHQHGIREDVGACRKIPEYIRLELKVDFEQKKVENEIYMEGVQEDGDEEDKVEEIVRLKSEKGLQHHQSPTEKDARARTIQYIARFFYRNEISFKVAQSNSFKLVIEVVGNYGPHLKSPSYYELRIPLLRKL
ncbi:hypothetical protein CR513_08897, partial [Mucuna pruriens]